MTETEASFGRLWSYRFTKPDGTEIEASDLNGDDTAQERARELSSSAATPVTVHRQHKLTGSWEYVIEVDERPSV